MKRSIGVMVLVSEQVLPALQAIWQVLGKEDLELRRVILLHTNDPDRSGAQAEQVERLCQKLLPSTIQTKRVPTFEVGGKGITPQEITKTILAVKACFPEIAHWTINASGGLKTMTIGVSNVLPDEEKAGNLDIAMVYRELNGTWFSLHRKGTQIEARELLPKPPSNLLHSMDVADLVRAQFADDRYVQKPSDLPDAQILRDNLLAITTQLVETRWDWARVFRNFSITEKGNNLGQYFEKYLTAILLEMGLTNLVWSFQTDLQNEPTPQSFRENDIVINHNDQMYFLDLKLRSAREGEVGDSLKEEPVGKQVRDAGETKRRLGGLSAEWVMIRPCRLFSPLEHKIVETHRNFRVFDQAAAQELLPRLAEMFRVSLSPKLEEIAALIRADATPFQAQLFGKDARPPKPMRSFGKHELSEAGQNWWLADLECLYVFRVTKNATGEQRVQEGQDWLAFLKACGIPKLTGQHSTNQWRFVWGGSAPHLLQTTLAPFVGKPICLWDGQTALLESAALEASDTAAPVPDADHS
jgi:hypothetical protein